jgi:divalent metal cation (Fe/Co/Zn/Cd) transporter
MSESIARVGVRDWARIGLWLVGATLAYNVLEGLIALAAGSLADSIALVGFGLDSGIECAAAGVLYWRLSLETRGVDPHTLERAERRGHRIVGATFLALAVYVSAQSLFGLWRGHLAQESPVGIALAAVSTLCMPLLAWGKLRAAREIGSAALRAEARETLACSYLSFALLLGLVANASAGWWWADPAAAIAMVPWLVREGLEGVRGESCAADDPT